MPAWNGEVLDPGVRLGIGSKSEIRDLLIWCARKDASDISFQTGQPVIAAIHGMYYSVTQQWLQTEDMRRIAIALAGSDSTVARLYSGHDVDLSVSYDVQDERDEAGFPASYRFRVNLTACYYDSGQGMQATLRYIKARPPRPDDVGLEPEIVAEGTPSQGAVLLVGETGSGKSTTTAALKRHILEGGSSHRGIILTYEAPIEYLFGNIPSSCCTIVQHEIPIHLPSFSAAIRNALRRNPCLIEIQEIRDTETIMAAVEASNTGHAVYATVHANSVAHTIPRLMQRFPADQKASSFYDIMGSTHMIVSQLLVPKVGGGRVCMREWQCLTPELKRALETAGPEHAFDTMQQHIAHGEAGRSMLETVNLKYDAGAITSATAATVLYRYGYRPEADAFRRASQASELTRDVNPPGPHSSGRAPFDVPRRTLVPSSHMDLVSAPASSA